MISVLRVVTLGLAAIATASPLSSEAALDPRAGPPEHPGPPERPGKDDCAPACGKYNFVFTGLPWNHPAVRASGFTPEQVEAGIPVLVGPENSLDDISRELKGVDWTGTGVGFGVRGNPSPVITRRLMGKWLLHLLSSHIIQLYRDEVPRARILFNYSPNSSVWAIQQYYPLPSSLDCSKNPGKDLGIAIHCSACSPPS
ncbi:hypothetical protein CCHL11_06793 [Colletotrichum chlorophyti]|uniref:Uncharacterized protein n=1 Tax=Colletotrichum chlorophyti TaxID=708187 RepID=A0A1Q8S982_9PEZI|nr:hypothetical protein CCHL11_06793 [Colletotrichum chlorophyti]